MIISLKCIATSSVFAQTSIQRAGSSVTEAIFGVFAVVSAIEFTRAVLRVSNGLRRSPRLGFRGIPELGQMVRRGDGELLELVCVLERQRRVRGLVAPGAQVVRVRQRSVCQALGFLADRKSTRLNSSHLVISYAVFCL